MKLGTFYISWKGSLAIHAILLASLTFNAQAQSTPFEVKPAGYAISVNNRPTDFEVYTIHNSPYCKIDDLARSMPGEFNVEAITAKNSNGNEYPEFRITTKREQGGSSVKPEEKNQLAQTVYAHLFVNKQRCPTTPYKISNGYFFKMADILRILDMELVIDHTKRNIQISTNKPFIMEQPTVPQPNSSPKKWTRVPAHVGIAVRHLNGYFDANSSSVLVNYVVDPSLWSNTLVIIHLPTGRRIELPFDEKENSYGGVYRGFSEGWVQVIAKVNNERVFTYINAVGEVINPKMFFTTARAFENGYAFVTYNEGGADYSGVINLKGEVIVSVAGKYEHAQFGNGVFGFETLVKRNHNTFYNHHYYSLDGKRINLPLSRAKELESPGYVLAEVEKFEPHRAKYNNTRYCGYNRFIVETNGNVKVVDSDNKTVFETNYKLHVFTPIFAWGKLFFRTKGIQDHNGKQILEEKYDIIEPVDGEAFLTIIDNKEQSLIGLDGKVLANSPNASLWALKSGELVSLKNYNFAWQVVPGEIVMIYSNMDLDKTLPTDNLKKLVVSRPHTQQWLDPTKSEAQRVIQNPRANALHVVALETLYMNLFSNQPRGK